MRLARTSARARTMHPWLYSAMLGGVVDNLLPSWKCRQTQFLSQSSMAALAVGKDHEIPNTDPHIVRLGAFWNKAAYEGKDVDLACVMFDETGVAKETIYYGLMMGRKRTVTMQADDATGMDDALIEINLGKMDPVIKAMAFTVNTGMGFDLSGLEEVKFSLKSETGVAIADCSLSQAAAGVKAAVVGIIFKDGEGWTVRYTMTPVLKACSWAEMMPEVKATVKFLFPEAPEHDAADYLRCMRPCDDMPVDALANLRFDGPPPPPPPSNDPAAPPPPPIADADAPQPEHVNKIRVDVGWLVKAKYEEAEVELETSLVLFNEVGEEVGQVNAGDGTDGVQMLGAEPVPEAEAEEEEAAEEEDEDAPKKPKMPKVFPPETTWFPVKERVAIDLNAVSPDVKCIVLYVHKYGEEDEENKGAFFKCEAVRAKVLATYGAGEEEGEEAEEDEEGEAKQEKIPDKMLSMFSLDTKQADAAGKRGVIMLKLYRDYKSSAYHAWRASPGEQPDLGVMATQMSIPKPGEGLPKTEEDEEVEEEPSAWLARLGLEWRLRTVGYWCGGEGVEDLTTKEAVAVATYDGKRTRAGLRHDKHSRSIYPNGDVYWGEYRETYRTGEGFYLFKGGTTFVGTLAEGSFDVGTLRHPDGSVYTGQHKGCLPDGQGEYTYPNGEKYAGGWAAGKKHGAGVYYYTDGSVLRGEWAAGVQHGDAKWEHCTAYVAQGAFDAGVPAQRWVWENKKTHLKQAGHYVCKELTEEELAEMEYDEESGPPKPQAPLWKGLVWNPDGMTFVDPPTAPAVEAVEPDTAPVEVEAKAEADAAPAEAEAAAAPAESSEGASAPAEEEAKPAEA